MLLVDIFPVTNADDEDQQNLVLHHVNHAVIANANATKPPLPPAEPPGEPEGSPQNQISYQ
jgi:hypothetical protein